MSFTGEYSSDDEDFKKVTEANFQNIHNKLAKIGYADGVSNGQEETFQTAFDTGYADGLRTGLEIEKYKAFYHNLNDLKLQNESLNREKILYTNMFVPVATDGSHCRFDEHSKETLSTISVNQNHYVDNILKQCQETLPLTTSLLATQNVVK